MGYGDGSGVPAGQTHLHDPSRPPAHTPQPPGNWPSTGLLLALIGSVATLWLAATGQLGLYIHPRYFVFTTIMVGLGLTAIVAAHAIGGRPPATDDHGHDHTPATGWRGRLKGSGATLAALALVFGLLITPPMMLTNTTVEQRAMNASVDADIQLMGGDPADFQLRDWAALLSRHSTAVTYAGQEITVSGFVSQALTSNPDQFYLSRFVVICCTVDAQPVGIPVAVEKWADSYPLASWVEIAGTLVLSEENTVGGVVLKPTTIQAIDQPAQPYDF